jgi:DNA polymerase I
MDLDRSKQAQPGPSAGPGSQTGTPITAHAEIDQGSPQISSAAAACSQPASLDGWTVYVVDSHSLIFQVFHALPEMTSPRGEPVGAVYGFVRDLVGLLETGQVDALLCAFDLPGPTFRHELFERYKADRGAMPEDLAAQIPKIRQVLEAMAIPILESPRFEADDVLATVARQCQQLEGHCLLVSGDKDCRQLIAPLVSIYNIRKGTTYDADALWQDWGVRPDQVVDFQALVGDQVDNVPGVPLIGPKLARELLGQYGTLEEILDHADEVSGTKRRQNLIEYREQALLSRQLVELNQQVPVQPDWNGARVGQMDHGRLGTLFEEFGFRGLADRVAVLVGKAAAAPRSAPARYQLVDSAEKLEDLVGQLKRQTLVSIDTETTSISPRLAEIVGYSLAWRPGWDWQTKPAEPTSAGQDSPSQQQEPIETCYVPVRGPTEDRTLDAEQVRLVLKPILEDRSIAKVGQNLKYDYVVLRAAGICLAGVTFDTMVASYLLEAGERSHNLDRLAQRHLGVTTIKIETLIGKGKQQKRMDEVAVADVGPYAAEDAEIPLRLLPLLSQQLGAQDLDELFETVEMPLVEILAEMEYRGVRIEPGRLLELRDQYRQRLAILADEIEQMAGHPLNIASPKQLRAVLFDELGLPVVKKTKTGPSTDASVLEELARIHPLPAKIVLHRQYAKLLSTYIDALPELVAPETGRVHASLNQVVTATGRLSSSNPNLQNIPVRTDEGREIRSAFRAGPEGWKLLAADYSQIELRILAHFSGDQTLCGAFACGQDIHALVAAQVEQVPLEAVDRAMRRRAKAVNFGILYGQSPFGLAKALGIPQEEAAEFIETYFSRYPGVLEFIGETLSRCRQRGFVTTLRGRRRAIEGVRPVPEQMREPKTGMIRQLNLPERTAINTVIQGSAADLIKMAMIVTDRRLTQEAISAKMILQIHDELLLEVAADEVDRLARIVKEEMEQVITLDVPLTVDVKWGDNWADCLPWEESRAES